MNRAAGLSALVVVHDEARQLADCLERLRFAAELVVVLDRCTDESAKIAARCSEEASRNAPGGVPRRRS